MAPPRRRARVGRGAGAGAGLRARADRASRPARALPRVFWLAMVALFAAVATEFAINYWGSTLIQEQTGRPGIVRHSGDGGRRRGRGDRTDRRLGADAATGSPPDAARRVRPGPGRFRRALDAPGRFRCRWSGCSSPVWGSPPCSPCSWTEGSCCPRATPTLPWRAPRWSWGWPPGRAPFALGRPRIGDVGAHGAAPGPGRGRHRAVRRRRLPARDATSAPSHRSLSRGRLQSPAPGGSSRRHFPCRRGHSGHGWVDRRWKWPPRVGGSVEGRLR